LSTNRTVQTLALVRGQPSSDNPLDFTHRIAELAILLAITQPLSYPRYELTLPATANLRLKCHLQPIGPDCGLGTFLYTGLKSRKRVTTCGINCSAKSMSSAEFCLPTLKRRLARARSGDNPIAVKTCEGSMAPDEQAAPVETDSPLRSSAITMASPSRQSNTMFVVLGTRGAPALLTPTWSMLSTMVRSMRSRSAAIRSTLPSVNPWRAISAALPSPTMPARFSVPARRERSWRPPYNSGCNNVPLRTYSAPAPIGPCIL